MWAQFRGWAVCVGPISWVGGVGGALSWVGGVCGPNFVGGRCGWRTFVGWLCVGGPISWMKSVCAAQFRGSLRPYDTSALRPSFIVVSQSCEFVPEVSADDQLHDLYNTGRV